MRLKQGPDTRGNVNGSRNGVTGVGEHPEVTLKRWLSLPPPQPIGEASCRLPGALGTWSYGPWCLHPSLWLMEGLQALLPLGSWFSPISSLLDPTPDCPERLPSPAVNYPFQSFSWSLMLKLAIAPSPCSGCWPTQAPPHFAGSFG